jgi:hypothetical protein
MEASLSVAACWWEDVEIHCSVSPYTFCAVISGLEHCVWPVCRRTYLCKVWLETRRGDLSFSDKVDAERTKSPLGFLLRKEFERNCPLKRKGGGFKECVGFC